LDIVAAMLASRAIDDEQGVHSEVILAQSRVTAIDAV
jgi:hypothetical protein